MIYVKNHIVSYRSIISKKRWCIMEVEKGKMLEKIISVLEEIKILSADEIVKVKTENLIAYIKSYGDFKNETTFKDILHEKVKETQNKDPELHLKLYMLYRELENGKINEKSAKELFEAYLQIYAENAIIYY